MNYFRWFKVVIIASESPESGDLDVEEAAACTNVATAVVATGSNNAKARIVVVVGTPRWPTPECQGKCFGGWFWRLVTLSDVEDSNRPGLLSPT